MGAAPKLALPAEAALVVEEDPVHHQRADSPEYQFDPEATLAMLAEQLHRLHRLAVPPPGDPRRPPEATLAAVVEQARRLTAEHPDAPVGRAYAHMSRRELFEVLEAQSTHLGEVSGTSLVITHGDPGLSALVCSQGEALGFADWEAIAVGDVHRDLAAVAASVLSVFGPMAVPAFFERYPLDPDPVRLDWWLLATQLTNTSDPAAENRSRTDG